MFFKFLITHFFLIILPIGIYFNELHFYLWKLILHYVPAISCLSITLELETELKFQLPASINDAMDIILIKIHLWNEIIMS